MDAAAKIDRLLEDAARHHRGARIWSIVFLGLAMVVVLGLVRELWPPSETQDPESASTSAPQG